MRYPRADLIAIAAAVTVGMTSPAWCDAVAPPPPRPLPGAGGLIAQRVIDREWGQSDDSTYVEIDVPGLKSEALATSLSAILPGAGQLYAEERSGWLFAAIEAAGWGGWWWYRKDAGRLNNEAAGIAGPPGEAASGWSLERWVAATDGDPTSLAALYAADREAFFDAIGSDPGYLAGWADPQARAAFGALRIRSDARLNRSRTFATGLWFNHLIAAVDALRAARFHNLPLRENVRVRVGGRGTLGAPVMTVALEVRF